MARERRSVRRSAFTSDKLSECNDTEMLVFIGLILIADDDGRESGKTQSIKTKLASRNWSPSRIASMMSKLNTLGLINWYSCECGIWYEINGWDEAQAGAWQGVSKVDSTISSYFEGNCKQCDAPLVLVGESTKNSSNRSEVKRREEKRTASPQFDTDFSEWWNTYPRKVGKVKARTCYDRLRSEDIPAQLLLDAALAYDDECYAEKIELRFQKHPATFLGPDRCFDDYAAMRGWKK